MSPRILDLKQCPHCEAPLERPVPRVCPHCAGSLQQRYLRWGCLSSKPLLILLGALLYRLLAA
jgi:predicted amidophosphoribosyltransferase